MFSNLTHFAECSRHTIYGLAEEYKQVASECFLKV